MTGFLHPACPTTARIGLRGGVVLVVTLACCGCARLGGAFESATDQTDHLAQLTWVMVVGGGLIWLLVLGVAVYASRLRPRPHGSRTVYLFLIGGGVVFPVVTLAALLVYSLRMLGEPVPGPSTMRVEVTGERWWWRVTYPDETGSPVALANEIRLPLDRPVTLVLRSYEVIHSLWIPALAGKLDLVPGHVNELVVQPRRTGVFRGTCAEYCGASHANMGLFVEVMEAAAFDDWLRAQSRPAFEPADDGARLGQALFRTRGCGLCHTVRGTEARGRVGPDLTHLASRHSIAAGVLPLEEAALRRWIRHADTIKPQALMPAFALHEDELQALSVYLGQLR